MAIKNGLRTNPGGDIAAPPYTKENYTWDCDTLDLSEADALLVNSIIVPSEMVINWPINASSVDENIFVADDAWQITSIEEAHTVASSSANVTIKKCSSTLAPNAGTIMHSCSLDLAAGANTVQSLTLSSTLADTQLADGERLALDYTGTMTSLAGGVVTIHLKRV